MSRNRTLTLECRHCGCRVSGITDTRVHTIKFQGRTRSIIRRRRVCHHCKLPFTTLEFHESEIDPLTLESLDQTLAGPQPLKPTNGQYPAQDGIKPTVRNGRLAELAARRLASQLPPEKGRRPTPKAKAPPRKKNQTKTPPPNPYL